MKKREEMGGFSVSPGLVSRAATELDERVRRWRDRKLNDHVYPYLMIDAHGAIRKAVAKHFQGATWHCVRCISFGNC